MIGLQEIKRRVELPDNTEPSKQVMECLKSGYFDYKEQNIFGTGWLQKEQNVPEMKADDAHEIAETLNGLRLREFIAKSSTTGLMGAAYLIPTKIYNLMNATAASTDIVDQISITVIPAEQIQGATMNVAIAIDEDHAGTSSLAPRYFSSGGSLAENEVSTTQATLDFTQPYGLNFNFGNDLIEDAAWDVMEMHIARAGREMGEFHTNQAIAILHAAADGDGTANNEAASNDETLLDDVLGGFSANFADSYVSNAYIAMQHQWVHSINKGSTNQADYATQWHTESISSTDSDKAMIFGMKRIWTLPNITMDPNSDLTACISYVLDTRHALLSGVKRWLRIENYSDPVRDLVGATVTARTDSVTVYKDARCTLTES